jgi:hypothetical protein
MSDLLFDVFTPQGFSVRVSLAYWDVITGRKHPVIRGREQDIQKTLESPEEVRVSQSDPAVYLFYREDRPGRWLCAVAKRLNGDGFLITAYLTDAIKMGVRLWPR